MLETSPASDLPYRSGLKYWKIWFTLILVICLAFVIPAIVLSSQSNLGAWIGVGMYVVMGCVGVGAVGRSYLDARYLDRETRLASEQVELLDETDDVEAFLHSAVASEFRSHIENLFLIAEKHYEISQDNLIEILHAKLLARNQVVELFANVLVTLGLIGTMVGLIFMMEGLSTTMGASGQQGNLLAELTKPGGPFTGLGVAFLTTLIGAVIGGVLLRILASVVDSSILTYVSYVAELTEVHVLPHLRSLSAQGRQIR